MPVSPANPEAFVASARAIWPAFGVDRQAFARHVASRLEDPSPPALERAGDLYLAYACAENDPDALRALDPIVHDTVARSVAHIDRSPAFADDVAQDLLEKLLVSRPAKIAEYAGRATLRSWLSTSALRVALNLRRGAAQAPGAHEPLASSSGPVARDPELDHLRGMYRDHFADALRSALAVLAPRDRAVLLLHLRQRATIDDLAAIYRVGRSTAARWLAAARARLVDATREELCKHLRVTPSEYESLAALVRSEVDLSLVRLLS